MTKKLLGSSKLYLQKKPWKPCGNNNVKLWTHNQKVKSLMETEVTDFDWVVTVVLAVFDWYYLLEKLPFHST